MWRRIAYRCGISRQRRFLKDRRGAAALEFAFVFPVFIVMVVTVMELSYHFLIGSVIESAALEASRFGLTGQSGAGTETREERIVRIIKENTYNLINPDDLVIDTLVYDSFSDIGKPEPFVDENDNGQYDNGEVYTDVNGNSQWDPDLGTAGLGGSRDIVIYRIRYTADGLTGLLEPFLGNFTHESIVAMRNEPY